MTTMKQQLNTWCLCLNEFLASLCWDAPKYLRGIDLFSLNSNLGGFLPIWHLFFYTSLNWCECCHSKSPMSLPCHHMMCQWHHNLFWTWKSAHAPGHLSGGHHSEQKAKGDMLLVPFTKGEMATPGAYCDICIQIKPFDVVFLSTPSIFWH